MIKSAFSGAFSALGSVLPNFPEISLTRDADVTLYMVHHSGDPEDYTFLIDFSTFMAERQLGTFSRPVLKIWAGRSDFDRARFARQLREAFSAEFQKLRASDPSPGWASSAGAELARMGDYLALMLLYAAVVSARTVTKLVLTATGLQGVANWIQGGEPNAKVDAEINEKKRVIDAALERIEIKLHRDLYRHAYIGLAPGPLTGMDYDAWPLPDFVQDRMRSTVTSSWW